MKWRKKLCGKSRNGKRILNDSYQWDAANRLKSVNNGSLGSYGYDGNGKRVKKTESGVTTYYVISSVLGSVMEVTSSGVQHAYVMSGSSVVAQLNPNGQF